MFLELVKKQRIGIVDLLKEVDIIGPVNALLFKSNNYFLNTAEINTLIYLLCRMHYLWNKGNWHKTFDMAVKK